MLRFSAGNLKSVSGITHAFFGRKGGVSTGIYASLNCGPGSNDDRNHVVENRRRALAAITSRECDLATLYQIHGSETVTVSKPWALGAGPKADAMVTGAPGVALGILTADCVPVLFADREVRLIGAAHAGWKGALAGVIESAVSAMEKCGARREHITAAIGPCISQANYEVGEEVRARVIARDAAHAQFFLSSDRPAHWRYDLAGFVRARLEASAIGDIESIAACTYAHESAFYSFRRTTHRGESDYGRQLSAIMLV